MKTKILLFTVAAALLSSSCSNSDKNATTDTVVVIKEVPSAQPAEQSATPEPAAVAEPEKSQTESLDPQVDKIIGIIKQQTQAVQRCIDGGILNSSSAAIRALEAVPDYERDLKKIKNKLSPAQKARINAAEQKLLRKIDEWDEASSPANWE